MGLGWRGGGVECCAEEEERLEARDMKQSSPLHDAVHVWLSVKEEG